MPDGKYCLSVAGVPLPPDDRRFIARQFWIQLGRDMEAMGLHWKNITNPPDEVIVLPSSFELVFERMYAPKQACMLHRRAQRAGRYRSLDYKGACVLSDCVYHDIRRQAREKDVEVVDPLPGSETDASCVCTYACVSVNRMTDTPLHIPSTGCACGFVSQRSFGIP